MADGRSMTTQEVVRRLLDEHGDFLKEAVAMVAAQLMEAEITAQIGAGRGEVSAERVTHRNGYRPRAWETRVGELELQIPRKRSGEAYFPSFLEPRRRCERAIVAVVMEAYVNGVSTRKVDRLVEQLGIHGMSKDRVSALCRALDEQVEAFRGRPLEGAHPYLWLDAKLVKVRARGHVYPKALVIAYAVHESGRREVIGLDIGELESEAFWVAFLRSLRERGLSGVRVCVSDSHEGLKTAIARVLACPWQRCTVHYADPPVMPTRFSKRCGGGRILPVVVGIIRALRGTRGARRVAGSGLAWRRAVWCARALSLSARDRRAGRSGSSRRVRVRAIARSRWCRSRRAAAASRRCAGACAASFLSRRRWQRWAA
jgi:hypothetical protein